MNRNHASFALSVTTTAAAVLAVAAMASGNAYADDITIDTTPFVSTKSRAEVRAELLGHSSAGSEWAMQQNDASVANSGYTRAQATAEYVASRREVSARNAEDSGSSFFAQLPRPIGDGGVILAEQAR